MLRSQFHAASGGDEAFDLFVQQFKGYVAAQYLGDLIPGPDGKLNKWDSLQVHHGRGVPHLPVARH